MGIHQGSYYCPPSKPASRGLFTQWRPGNWFYVRVLSIPECRTAHCNKLRGRFKHMAVAHLEYMH